MNSVLIQNGRVIDPANGRDEIADVWVENGVIAAIGRGLDVNGAERFDAKGKVVAPGFVDLNCHLREPGHESQETIATGTRAAAAGGFTTLIPMPNTDPVIDTAADITFIQERARSRSVVHIYPIAAVTKGQKGEQVVEFGDLVHAGAIGFSNNNVPIMNSEILRRALEYCAMFDVPILDHCLDVNLAGAGVMREGASSTRLGMRGIPSAAESIQVARDIALAEYTGGRIHIQHVSNRRSLVFIERAKQIGLSVTTEITPHHLALTDEALSEYNTNFKMIPPLGSENDRQALRQGLADGLIDCIVSDHAPHTAKDKDKVFDEAPFGVIGLETAFAAAHNDLVNSGLITLSQLIEKMTINPAKIMNLDKGTLSLGASADIAVIDSEWRGAINETWFQSRGRNCPFLGAEITGRVCATFVDGLLVFKDGEVLV